MRKIKPIVLLSAVLYVVMIVVNALANILPINGISTGAVSDSYPNLFAPIGFTFAIWGVIYFLLAVFTAHTFHLFRRNDNQIGETKYDQIMALFSLSSLLNTIWIFTWHYGVIWLSALLMVLILICLIQIRRLMRAQKMSQFETLAVKLPFVIYFGWITVATIANITTLLVNLDWNGFGLSPAWWTVIIVLVGAWIGGTTFAKFRDYGYGAVLIWAYIGILAKHSVAAPGFHGAYPLVIVAVSLAIAFFVLIGIYVIRADIRRRNNQREKSPQ